jgi:hypothetical protein
MRLVSNYLAPHSATQSRVTRISRGPNLKRVFALSCDGIIVPDDGFNQRRGCDCKQSRVSPRMGCRSQHRRLVDRSWMPAFHSEGDWRITQGGWGGDYALTETGPMRCRSSHQLSDLSTSNLSVVSQSLAVHPHSRTVPGHTTVKPSHLPLSSPPINPHQTRQTSPSIPPETLTKKWRRETSCCCRCSNQEKNRRGGHPH